MEAKEQVLEILKNNEEPLNAGKIAEMSGLDRKVVDKAMAALKAEGRSCVTELSHIDRGYADFEGKLRKLGAKIKRQQ